MNTYLMLLHFVQSKLQLKIILQFWDFLLYPTVKASEHNRNSPLSVCLPVCLSVCLSMRYLQLIITSNVMQVCICIRRQIRILKHSENSPPGSDDNFTVTVPSPIRDETMQLVSTCAQRLKW